MTHGAENKEDHNNGSYSRRGHFIWAVEARL